MSIKNFLTLSALLATASPVLAGPLFPFSSENPESYRIEVMASMWRMDTGGHINADSTPIDLITDLGVRQKKYTFDGKLTLKPTKRSRIVIEGIPIALRGNNSTTKTVTYFGETYSFSDTLTSAGNMNYIYAGYHHDWISNSWGRLGTSIGGAYLGLSGSILSQESGINKAASSPFGMPMVGADFRLFPVPHKSWVELEGGVRGLPAGGYGHWVEYSVSGGGRIGSIGLLAGYRAMLIDFHETGGSGNGIVLNMRGPLFSLIYSW